jgi:hypothetical protein
MIARDLVYWARSASVDMWNSRLTGQVSRPELRNTGTSEALLKFERSKTMFSHWKILIAALLIFCAGVTAQAAGAQSEPKQKGAEKGEPAPSETDGERRQPSRPNETPGESKSPSSLPSVPPVIQK